jgi:hypothetical protein
VSFSVPKARQADVVEHFAQQFCHRLVGCDSTTITLLKPQDCLDVALNLLLPFPTYEALA